MWITVNEAQFSPTTIVNKSAVWDYCGYLSSSFEYVLHVIRINPLHIKDKSIILSLSSKGKKWKSV